MAHRSTLTSTTLAALGLLAAACGGGSSVSNASPRLSEVPLQSTAGGPFTLDLADYVTDREGATLTYAVTSGGGAFAGSTYSNTFDTMGTYTVGFTVFDGDKTTAGTFDVQITSANFAVVREDASGLLLLDTATNAQVRLASQATTPSLAAGLSDGRVVYHLAGSGSGQQLWIFDPMTRQNTRVGATEAGDVTWRASTSTNAIVYSAGPAPDLTIAFFNPRTGISRELAQSGLATLDVLVDADDVVFYEVGVNGQADVYAYDPAEDETFVIADEVRAEQLLAVLPEGGVLVSRVGAGGETDLFHWRSGTGLVEVGSDVAVLDTRSKTFHALGGDGQVVFTALNGTDREVWFWNPATGQTTAIATGTDNVFAAIGAGDEVVYTRVVSATEHDVRFHDLDDGTAAVVRDANDVGAVLAVTSDGTTAWAIVRGSGDTGNLHAISLVATPATQTWAAGGAVATSVGVVTNGDVVAERVDGTALNVFDVSAATWGPGATGTGLSFEGNGLDAGDFVYTVTAGGQQDLAMWDASAASTVVVSDVVGADTFAARTEDGTILFTRVTAGNTNTDLFAWNGTTATQLTDADASGRRHDHAVLGQFSGSR